MKPYVLFVLISSIFLLGACIPFRYAEPQPVRGRELSSFPDKLWGFYVSNDGDSVRIAEDYFSIGGGDALKLEDDELVVKRTRGMYVISAKHFVKDQDSEAYLGWEVLPVVFRHDSMFVYFLPAVNENIAQRTYKTIKDLTDIDIMKEMDEDYYLIQKRRKAFKVLWKNGVYSEMISYKKQ